MKYLSILTLLIILGACSAPTSQNQETASEDQVVNVYSQRHYDADKAVLEMFTEETGIQVNVVKAGADELINRLEMEGENSPADVFITVDAARLNRAKSKGLLQPIEIATDSMLPEGLKDADNQWYPITYRARVIAYDKEQVDPSTLSSYEDLADPKWENQIVIRSSSSGYNQSLLASIIEAKGEAAAKTWAAGVVNNMARDPKGGDRDQIKAIASGVGTISVVNTYYVGLLLNSENPEEVAVGESVGIFFPNQDDRGTHINISGAGVTKYAPNKENAIKLIEFLTSEKIQAFYAAESFEYPANSNVEADATVASFGTFFADELDFAKDMSLTEKAVQIFDEVGWK